MTPEEKELLLRDLCARYPYGVMAKFGDSRPLKITKIGQFYGSKLWYVESEFESSAIRGSLPNIKPYLFPLSSMTEEQWNNAPRVDLTDFTFESFKCGCFTLASYTSENNLHDLIEFMNWLLKNHFDINGLIPLGLANDATGLNIY